jgi:chromosome segregation ATPase
VTMTRIPDTLVAVLGEPAGRDLTDWLEVIMDEGTVRRDEWAQTEVRFDKVETRLDAVEVRLDKVEVRLGGVESRLVKVEVRMEAVESGLVEVKTDLRELRRTVDDRFDRLQIAIDQRFDNINLEMTRRSDELQRTIIGQTRWSVGVLALFATMVTVLLAINQFTR